MTVASAAAGMRRGVPLAGVVIALLMTTGCASSGGTVSPVGVDAAVTSGMDPARDGFSFANFTAADTEEHFDLTDLKSMFGAGTDVCLYGDAETCIPTPEAAAFARMVNLARASGHCEGLVVRAAELFAQRPPSPVASLANEGEVTHGVIRTFATQLFRPVRREAESWAARSLDEIAAALGESLSRGEVRYSMGLYTQAGGHSVLPVSMERAGEEMVRVDVYDPNWPGERRPVHLDLQRGRWQFSFGSPDPASDPSPWTGGAGDIDLVDLETRRDGGCPFCGESESAEGLMLVRSAGSDWSVQTRGGVLTAGSSSDVAGTVRPLRAGSPRDHVVDVGDTTGTVTLTLSSSARVSALWPRAIVEIEVVQPDRDVVVTLREDGVEVVGGTATVAVSRGHLGLTVTSDDVVVEHGADRIVATDRSAGTREEVDAGRKTNSALMTELTVELPPVLVRVTDVVAPVETTVPAVPVTGAPRPVAGPSPLARITFSVEGWALPLDDERSFGFVAVDVVGGVDDETQVCRSIACLADKTVWLPRGGYDPSRDTWVMSPYEFRLTGVRGPFDVRCGRSAGWTPASGDGDTHRATCAFDSVDTDVAIALRAR